MIYFINLGLRDISAKKKHNCWLHSRARYKAHFVISFYYILIQLIHSESFSFYSNHNYLLFVISDGTCDSNVNRSCCKWQLALLACLLFLSLFFWFSRNSEGIVYAELLLYRFSLVVGILFYSNIDCTIKRFECQWLIKWWNWVSLWNIGESYSTIRK